MGVNQREQARATRTPPSLLRELAQRRSVLIVGEDETVGSVEGALHSLGPRLVGTGFDATRHPPDLAILCAALLSPAKLWIRRWIDSVSEQRAIVVTQLSGPNVRELLVYAPATVVGLSEVESRLLAITLKLLESSPSEGALAALRRGGVGRLLLSWIGVALKQAMLPKSVEEWARLCGVPPRTFRYHFQKEGVGLTARQVLDLITVAVYHDGNPRLRWVHWGRRAIAAKSARLDSDGHPLLQRLDFR